MTKKEKDVHSESDGTYEAEHEKATDHVAAEAVPPAPKVRQSTRLRSVPKPDYVHLLQSKGDDPSWSVRLI